MDKRSALSQFTFFSDAPPALRERIEQSAMQVALGAGADFYFEGDTLDVFAFVGRGDIRVYKLAPTGREIALYHVQDGESCLVNMLCVYLARPAMASARAEADTQAIAIPASTFREWVATEESVRRYVFSTMAKRMVDVMTLVEEVAFRRVDQRLAQLLSRRFGAEGESPKALATTHEELAAELGTVREVVSRLLKEFERGGILTVSRGRLELKDDLRLRTIAEPNDL
ncbi:MAG: Crp/Fnr family transcriptional regulator [Armatimonadetes bacterium]|nr:Crp/Fnr family transcriptional regulator [Armatimonadota bacterium]